MTAFIAALQGQAHTAHKNTAQSGCQILCIERTTVAIKPDTRARLKAGAASEAQTIDAFIRSRRDEHERARFWATRHDLTPETHAQNAAADGDELDASYALDDSALDEAARDGSYSIGEQTRTVSVRRVTRVDHIGHDVINVVRVVQTLLGAL